MPLKYWTKDPLWVLEPPRRWLERVKTVNTTKRDRAAANASEKTQKTYRIADKRLEALSCRVNPNIFTYEKVCTNIAGAD